MKTKQKQPNSVDVAVGQRLRVVRLERGLPQSFQQIPKYEKGIIRVRASRLQQFAGLLDVGVIGVGSQRETNSLLKKLSPSKQSSGKQQLKWIFDRSARSDAA